MGRLAFLVRAAAATRNSAAVARRETTPANQGESLPATPSVSTPPAPKRPENSFSPPPAPIYSETARQLKNWLMKPHDPPPDSRAVVALADRDRFLAALARDLPPEERLILCGFAGDPGKAPAAAWRPRPWAPGRDVDLALGANAYVTVASFGRASDNSFRRRAETFAAGRALMVDDVGTKVPRSVVEATPPTARIETSPGNEQWWYLLDRPERDAARFDAVIRAFIAGKLLGADPGMSGIARVGRLPAHTNGKPQHKGWRCELRSLDEDRRFSIDDLLAAFQLTLNGRREPRSRLLTEEALERNRAFGIAYGWLQQRGLFKRSTPDTSGWTEMSCPWVDDHTGAADTGAAIRDPAAENEYHGAFRCHHGHCADRGWADLTDWIAECAAEELA